MACLYSEHDWLENQKKNKCYALYSKQVKQIIYVARRAALQVLNISQQGEQLNYTQ